MPELAAGAPVPLLPPLVLAALLACGAGASALATCALLAALLKRSKNGLFSIMVQLAIADVILVGTSITPELWSCNAGTWYFGSIACTAHQGLNVFSSTASLYLMCALALHALATYNLEQKVAKRRMKRNNREEDEEIKSSQHSLVANSDSSTPPRTMNVDYRVADTRVPVTLPCVSVWVLSASLSIPEFALASTVHLEQGVVVCTLDSSHQLNMRSMLAVFNLFIPFLIISTTSALIIGKLRSKKNILDNCESIPALKLSLWLMFLYGILCAPRSIINAYSVYSGSMDQNESPMRKVTEDKTFVVMMCFALDCACLVAALIRPLVCIAVMPRLRKVLSFNANDINNV